jgi:hypothetical protein
MRTTIKRTVSRGIRRGGRRVAEQASTPRNPQEVPPVSIDKWLCRPAGGNQPPCEEASHLGRSLGHGCSGRSCDRGCVPTDSRDAVSTTGAWLHPYTRSRIGPMRTEKPRLERTGLCRLCLRGVQCYSRRSISVAILSHIASIRDAIGTDRATFHSLRSPSTSSARSGSPAIHSSISVSRKYQAHPQKTLLVVSTRTRPPRDHPSSRRDGARRT